MKHIIVLTSILFVSQTSQADHREHKAHEHGAAKLNIALDGNSLEIEIDSPAHDFVGFEHLPKSNAEKQAVQKAYDILVEPKNILNLPTAAECKTVKVNVTEGYVFAELIKHKNADTNKGHSDIGITYTLTCAKPENLKGTKVILLGKFKIMKKINIQTAINGQQSSEVQSEDQMPAPGL